MRPRFPWIALAVIAGFAALIGLAAGRHVATLTETDVIAAAAAQYVDEHGGQATDCVAEPGIPPVWLNVFCGRGESRAIYQADRFGRLTQLPPADPADAAQI